jgi:hypothetical protein
MNLPPIPPLVVIKAYRGEWSLHEVGTIAATEHSDVFGIQSMPGVLTVTPVISYEKIVKALGHTRFSYEVVLFENRPF